MIKYRLNLNILHVQYGLDLNAAVNESINRNEIVQTF